MPSLRVAGPLLEHTPVTPRDISKTGLRRTPPAESLAESPADCMVDTREAALAMRLPHYWFADQMMRDRYRIPHYRFGDLVRFRLSDLQAWALWRSRRKASSRPKPRRRAPPSASNPTDQENAA